MINVEDVGTRVEQVAKDVWNVTSWPEEDLAAALGWDAGWLIMTLMSLKTLAVGLSLEFKRTHGR